MSEFRPTYGRIDHDYGRRLATMDPNQDGPIHMVNLMQYRVVADYGDSGEGSADEGVSGREADDRYAPVAILAEIGAEVVFYGDVVTQHGETSPRWDRVGVVRYPTRRSFIEMQTREDFRDKHRHKQAGMAATIVMGCLPDDEGGFVVEGTIMGDGRSYAHVRFVTDPQRDLVVVEVIGDVTYRLEVSAVSDLVSS